MSETVEVLAAELLRQHNEGFAQGTERESHATPPVWMTRQAERLASALETDEAAGLRDEVEALRLDTKNLSRGAARFMRERDEARAKLANLQMNLDDLAKNWDEFDAPEFAEELQIVLRSSKESR